MTTTTMSTSAKNILLGMLAMVMVFFFYSCAKKTTATKSAEPAAATVSTATVPQNKGQVQIKRDANSNYVIQINLRELEEFSKIDPASKKAYIVWMDADNQSTKNLGQINSNSGWLTDKSKASFEAVSAFKPTKIFITAEDNTTVKTPGKNVIWSTNSF